MRITMDNIKRDIAQGYADFTDGIVTAIQD